MDHHSMIRGMADAIMYDHVDGRVHTVTVARPTHQCMKRAIKAYDTPAAAPAIKGGA
jgi:hypothetical protein